MQPRFFSRLALAWLALAWFALAPSAAAQAALGDLLLCDTAQDQLVRLSDLDQDQSYLSPLEAVSFYADPGGSPRDVQMRLEGGLVAAYWVDTVRDAVYRGIDLNLGPLP